ncbi:hypothetical protein MGR01S_06790 [Meiothermus granaticius NBRC 107808]|nr:hypothetical protein MGR01S_06790 [Meiothermus granaticius NBRC 107808]
MVNGGAASAERESKAKLAYSVEEFAQAVGLSRNHAYALVRGGIVKAVRAGSRWVIPIKAVECWLEDKDDCAGRNR